MLAGRRCHGAAYRGGRAALASGPASGWQTLGEGGEDWVRECQPSFPPGQTSSEQVSHARVAKAWWRDAVRYLLGSAVSSRGSCQRRVPWPFGEARENCHRCTQVGARPVVRGCGPTRKSVFSSPDVHALRRVYGGWKQSNASYHAMPEGHDEAQCGTDQACASRTAPTYGGSGCRCLSRGVTEIGTLGRGPTAQEAAAPGLLRVFVAGVSLSGWSAQENE